jgi:hypothetical protein
MLPNRTTGDSHHLCFSPLAQDRVRARDPGYRDTVSCAHRTVGVLHSATAADTSTGARRLVSLPGHYGTAQQPAVRTYHAARHRTGEL